MTVPNYNYVAISKDKTTYVYLNDLRNCVKSINRIYICNKLDVLSVQNVPTCETEILTKVLDKVPQQCETKLVYGKIDIWQELTGNRWLFVETESIMLTVECQTQISDFKLLGTGILNLPPNCKASYNNREILTNNNVNVTIKQLTSNFNLILDPCCDEVKFDLIKQKLKPINLTDINLEKLKKVTNNQLITDIDKIINESEPLKIMTHITLYLLIV